jgi:hypothetical protein
MIMIRSQKLSCSAGQWYFVRIRWTTTASAVIVDSEDAMLLAGEKVRYMLRGGLSAVAGSSESRKPVFRPALSFLSFFPVFSFCFRVMLGSSILE